MYDYENTLLFAQEGNGIVAAIAWVIMIPVTVLVIAGMWKTFTKAGKPGWGAIIPIYNTILMLEIAERPIWWILLLLIPVVNIIVSIVVSIDIAKNFDKGAGFGLGLAFFGFIFYPILGFGSAQYKTASLTPGS
jgi:hypothetical protein